MAAPTREEPSETSPLLQPDNDDGVSKISSKTVANGAVPNGANEVINDDVERRTSVDDSRAAQYAGNAEARKMLKYILPAVSIGVFLSAADQTIIVSSYGQIGSDLNALNLTSWIGTSYFLTLASFQPLYGKLSDIFGRKACLLWAYAIFGLGGLFCGLAQSIEQLIAARVFQGIGGGGMTTVVSIMFSDIVPLKERGVWQGLINIIYATGAAAGAPAGGLLSDSIGWRWAFLIQAPLCLLAFIAAIFAIRIPAAAPFTTSNTTTTDWRKRLRRIDFLGAFILLSAVGTLIFGLDRGCNVSWRQPVSYAPLASSLVFFALFIHIETRVATEPFAPGHIIFSRAMVASYLCNFFSFGAWLAALFYIPLYYQAYGNLSATGAAIRLLPAIVSSVCGSLFGGFYMKRTGRFYHLTIVGYTLLPTGLVMILLFSGLVIYSTVFITVGTVLCAFGNGIGVTTSLIALISNAEPADQAVATACSYLFRSLGSVVGLSLSATVIQSSLRSDLAVHLGDGGGDDDAEEIERGVRRSLKFIRQLPPDVASVVRESYAHAVRDGYVLMIGLAVGAMASAYFIREKRLSR